ncbi:MAG: hypothetical protein DMG08_16815 [Acidobacteria bacterium]|nr:MAG: hypothetical protein DMG08_16815 [Acidobacteriota bacterium]
MNDDTDLTVNALIDAFLAWDKYRNAHQDLREYHKKRLEILQSIFGCDVEKRQAELDREAEKLRRKVSHNEYFYDIDGRATVEFMQDCIRLLNSTKSPFDCKIYLEGKPPKLVRDLRAKHQKEIALLKRTLTR